MTKEQILDELWALKARVMETYAKVSRDEPPKPPTISDVYGDDPVGAPDGMELTGEFREPKLGECFVNRFGYAITRTNEDASLGPRLLLRPNPPTPTVEAVYGKPLAELSPPHGYRWKRDAEGNPIFRKAEPGETTYEVLPPEGAHTWHCVSHGTRLLLERAPRLVFDILGENRRPKRGEVMQTSDRPDILRASFNWNDTVRRILSEPRVEESR